MTDSEFGTGFFGALTTLVTSEYTEVTAVPDVSFDVAASEAVGI